MFACVVIGVAAGVALALTADMPSRLARLSLRTGCAVAALGAGLVAIGLDRHYLAPRHWDEFVDGLDRGFAALGAAEWPYSGPEVWTRLTLLLAIPLVLSLASAFTFWPGAGARDRWRSSCSSASTGWP